MARKWKPQKPRSSLCTLQMIQVNIAQSLCELRVTSKHHAKLLISPCSELLQSFLFRLCTCSPIKSHGDTLSGVHLAKGKEEEVPHMANLSANWPTKIVIVQ